jgi:hypothetical protein
VKPLADEEVEYGSPVDHTSNFMPQSFVLDRKREEVQAMPSRRRYLVAQDLRASTVEAYQTVQAERFAQCPEAAQYPDEETEDFMAVAQYIDSVSEKELVDSLRRAHIAFPPDLAFDKYRLARHVLRRWRESTLRDALLERGVGLDFQELAKMKRKGKMQAYLTFVDRYGPPAALSIMRHYGMAEMIPSLVSAFSPAQDGRHRALLQRGKLLMHSCLTEPEPPRRPSRWEQQKLARRIHLREVQLTSLRGSLIKLGHERKALLNRLAEAGRREQPELQALAVELEQIRIASKQAQRQHRAELAQQAQRYNDEITRLQGELAAAQQGYTEAMTIRTAWLLMQRRR